MLTCKLTSSKHLSAHLFTRTSVPAKIYFAKSETIDLLQTISTTLWSHFCLIFSQSKFLKSFFFFFCLICLKCIFKWAVRSSIYAVTKLTLHNHTRQIPGACGRCKKKLIWLPSCSKLVEKYLNIFGWHQDCWGQKKTEETWSASVKVNRVIKSELQLTW